MSARPRDPDPPPQQWSLDELAEYHTGAMDPDRASTFARIVEDDAEAQAGLQALDRTIAALRSHGAVTAAAADSIPSFKRAVWYADQRPSVAPVPPAGFASADPITGLISALPVPPDPGSDGTGHRRPTSGRRRSMVRWWSLAAASALLLVVVLVGVRLGTPAGGEGTSASPGTASGTATPTPKDVPVAYLRPDVARAELVMPGVDTATLYFGRLGPLVDALSGQVEFAVDPAILQSSSDLCAETVVVTGVRTPTAAVYAEGLGPGWGAVEQAPPSVPSGPTGQVHQQIVVPPATSPPGTRFMPGARLVAGPLDTTSNAVALVLDRQDGADRIWRLGASGIAITCRVD